MVIECLTGVSFTSAGAHRFCYNMETACSKEEGIDEYVISFEFSLLPTSEAAIQMFGVCMTTGQCKVSNCLSSVVAQEHCFTQAWETHYVPFPFWLLHWGGRTSIIYCDSMVTPHIFIESQWDTEVHKILQKHLLSKSAGCSTVQHSCIGSVYIRAESKNWSVGLGLAVICGWCSGSGSAFLVEIACEVLAPQVLQQGWNASMISHDLKTCCHHWALHPSVIIPPDWFREKWCSAFLLSVDYTRILFLLWHLFILV